MSNSYCNTDERILLQSLIQGDTSAFNKLYNLYGKKLYLQIFTMTKSADVAEELLQDVFMKVWDNRGTIDIEQSFQAWIHTISRNLVYTHYRKAAKDQKIQEQLYLHFEQLYHLDVDVDIREKQEALLNRAMGELSPRRQQVFMLCKIERKSYLEVADLLGISVSTVSNIMVKSNQQIRNFVQEHYEEILTLLIAAYIV